MLQANKATLLTQFNLDTLDIRQQEMDYWMDIYDKLAALAGMCAGFASGLVAGGLDDNFNIFLFFFKVIAGVCLGLNLTVLMTATLCTMWGPGKTLRGQGHEAVDNAIAFLESLHYQLEFYFSIGLICFCLCCGLSVFTSFNFIGAFVINIGFFLFVVLMVVQWRYVLVKAFTPEHYVRGNLEGLPEPLHNIGRFAFGNDPGVTNNATYDTRFANRI